MPPEATIEAEFAPMRRRFLFVAAALAVTASSATVTAQEAGRYQLAPGAEGFVRLDTRTGATSHCTRQDDVWRCAPVIEQTGALAAELEVLSADVARLAAGLAELGARVDTLAARLDRPAPAATEDIAPGEDRGLVATAVARLFALVRLLKHGGTEA
jgi:hypothetical protein